MPLPTARVDWAFNAQWNLYKRDPSKIQQALAEIKARIGPVSMPPDYVPPPLRKAPAASSANGLATVGGVYEITVGTISWINATPCPIFRSDQVMSLDPDWVPKTYLGLNATSNETPPKQVDDFKAYQDGGDFRALTFCRFALTLEGGTGAVTGFEVLEAAHDGGWTPPFKVLYWPGTALSFDPEIYSDQWYQGEYSPISVVKTRGRHRNTAIKGVNPDEEVLVNALIKFRAGSHTDNIGVTSVRSPFHVPWVWCEMLVTFANGKLKCYGRGSVFPSHGWYVHGQRVIRQNQVGDQAFPMMSYAHLPQAVPQLPWAHFKAMNSPKNLIDLRLLKIYSVLAKGVPASQPQSPLGADSELKGRVSRHPNTVWGGTTHIVSLDLE